MTSKPGPGVNFINPNGFVAAASITSQTFTPNFSHIIAISFARPILIALNVFSSSFTISAVSVELTFIIFLIILEYSSSPTSAHFFDTPPIIFGVLFVPYSVLPGSILSGLKHKHILLPGSKFLLF